jgi:hypothetical protein
LTECKTTESIHTFPLLCDVAFKPTLAESSPLAPNRDGRNLVVRVGLSGGGGGVALYCHELNKVRSSTDIIKMNKSRRTIGAWGAVRMGRS